MQSKPELCTYCGKALTTRTMDHAPPQCLFPPPLPQLRTVPSCEDCNCGDAQDDEYFRFVLTQAAETAGQAPIEALRHTVARSFNRPEAARFKASIFERISFPKNYHPSGNYIGPNPSGEIDLPRMKRVANRILRAYFYIHTEGRRIPDSHEVITFINDEHLFFGRHIGKFFDDTLKDQPEHKIGDGSVFKYSFAFPPSEDADTSVWGFLYYNAYPILSIVRRPRVRAADADGDLSKGVRLHIVPADEAASPRVRRERNTKHSE